MSNAIALDSNILIYASSKGFEKHNEAKMLVDKVFSGGLEAALCAQNLNEFIATVTNSKKMSNPLKLGDAVNEASKLVNTGFELLNPNDKTWQTFELIVKQKPKYKGQLIYDLFLAATLISNGVDTLITENVKDFEGIKGFKAMEIGELKYGT